MLLSDNLLTTFQLKIQGIPEVVEDIGDVNAIDTFIESDPAYAYLPEAIADMPDPGMLIVYDGTELGFRGVITQWRHNFSIYIRMPANPSVIIRHILDGVTTYALPGQPVSGLSFLNDEIDTYCDPPELVSITRENDTIKNRHVWRLALSLQEKGGRGF